MNDIEKVSQELMAAVLIVMDPDPLVNHQQRSEACQKCELFKNNSPLCAQCGLHLSNKTNPAVVRHFGLQLIEHCIKLRWNSMSVEEKLFIKNNAMELLASGSKPILEEEKHIKDVLSRIVVEMIKREWPQQWPLLLDELNSFCAMGETQKELVLLIFSRLLEDVAILQNTPQQRRREVLRELTANLPAIWKFFLHTLEEHYKKYKDCSEAASVLSANPPESQIKSRQSLIHGRVVETLLETLICGYLEWISLNYIECENYLVLRMLCLLLSDEKLKQRAAECLLILVSRKGKVEERRPFMVLFSADAMEAVFRSTKISSDYAFLKIMCRVLAGLGSQLSALWGVIDKVECPETFCKFLETAIAFSGHDSQLLSSYTIPLWTTFFQNKSICQNQIFLQVLETLLKICSAKLAKVGFPSRKDSPSCEYSRADFDNDEDFIHFFNKFRTDLCEVIRHITLVNPTLAFEFASKWLRDILVKPIGLGQDVENGFCGHHSPSAIEWDTLGWYLECVQSKISLSTEPRPDASEGLALLKAVINFETADPVILSSVLSCVSALFSYTSQEATYIPVVLKKIFSAVIYNLPGETKRVRTKSVKNVRRHACSALVKICCKQQSGLLLPWFDHIYEHVKNLGDEMDQLSSMEKCTLYEMVVMINNDFNDYEKQSKFLQEVIHSVKESWLKPPISNCFSSVEGLISIAGLSEPPVEVAFDNASGNCSIKSIIHCLSFLLGLLKRSKWPDNAEVAAKGGFVLCQNEDGTVSYRNPVTPSLSPIFESLFLLIRVVNSLWVPEIRAKFHPAYRDVLDLMEWEKNVILGISSYLPEPRPKTNVERMQNFIGGLFENSYTILGAAGATCGMEFYQLPLADIISKTALTNLEHMADYRLKTMIRVFWRPLTQNCSPNLEEAVVLPILEKFCPFMFNKLALRWETFRQRYSNCDSYEDEMTETQEILEDQISRLLTREYFDMLISILLSKKSVVQVNPDLMDDDMEQHPTTPAGILSNLGVKLMRNETICSAIVMTVFSGLHWQDSQSSIKSSQICWPVLKQMVSDDALKNEEEAHYIFQSVMKGLFHLGRHNVNCALLTQLGLQVYELLRPNFTALSNILMELTGCQSQDIITLEQKLLGERKLHEKKRKEIFKNFVSCIIGKDIGEMFKNDIKIKNLEPNPLFVRQKRNVTVLETESESGICTLFS